MERLSLLSPSVRLPLAIAGGVLLALTLWRLSAYAASLGHEVLASSLYWQDTWLHAIALSRQGSPDDPSPALYRLLNIPLGVLVYGSAIYVFLFVVGRLRASAVRQ